MIQLYDVFTSLGVAVFLFLTFKNARKDGFSPELSLGMGLIFLTGGLIGGRSFYHAFHAVPLESPLNLIRYDRGGFMFHGVLVGGIFATFFITTICKTSFIKALDSLFPSFAASTACWRLGCFKAGCCFGCNVSILGSPSFRLPLPLIETGFLICLVWFVDVIKKKPSKNPFVGISAGLYLLLHGTFRILSDNWRADDLGFNISCLNIPCTTFFSIGMILGGLLILSKFRKIFNLKKLKKMI
ncbi:MAG: prolipoprotein diacylglyceryl transferase [Candidatus Riflebacteria bacterium]|nr:prolipoprotein diacylglyceryl transferase [Candidatus Riflebacteria bacterium]